MATYESWFLGGDPGWDWTGHPTLAHSFDPVDVPPGAPVGAHSLLIQQTSAAAPGSQTDPAYMYESPTPVFTLGPGTGDAELSVWIRYESPNAVYPFVGIRFVAYNVTGGYPAGGFAISAEEPWTQHLFTMAVPEAATQFRWQLFADPFFTVGAFDYVGTSTLCITGLYVSGEPPTSGPRVLPPLRRLQRGDELAIGGTPRAVQKRSRQSSLRRSSAYL